jgi:hypothetical protein
LRQQKRQQKGIGWHEQNKSIVAGWQMSLVDLGWQRQL